MNKADKIKLQIAIYDGFIKESTTHEYASVATHCLINMKRNYENLLLERNELIEQMEHVSNLLPVNSIQFKLLQNSIMNVVKEDVDS